jgi:hypothetical protein
MSETKLGNHIADYIKISPQSFALKLHGNGIQKKTVDYIGGWRGVPFAIEVKLPGKEYTTTLSQKASLQQFKQCGYVVGVVTSIEDFINLDWPT